MARTKRNVPEPDIEALTPSEVSAASGDSGPQAEWQPPPGCLVSDARTFRLYVDGRWYEHIHEAPDGRWVYGPS